MFVKRTDTSSYFPAHFLQEEKKRIESIKGLRYLAPEDPLPPQAPTILLTNTHTQLSHWEHVRGQTQLILHPNSGYDNLLPYSWTCPVLLGNPIRSQAVAEWCLSALYQSLAPIRPFSRWPKSRAWPRLRLDECKILIIGHGHVGQILQRHLKAQVYDPWLNLSADLYAGYDVVILAASLNPESRGLLAETFFASCPEHLLLINAARAELIDQTALLQFLSRAPRARAVLDVHLSEPYSTAPYPSHQVIATPHIAGVWAGLIEEMLRFEVQQLQEFTQGRLDQNLLLSNRMTPQGFYR